MMHVTTRQLTGTPRVHHAYIYAGNKVVAACTHRHRSSVVAQRCGADMLSELELRMKDQCPKRGPGGRCVWRSGEVKGEFGSCVYCGSTPPKPEKPIDLKRSKAGRGKKPKSLSWSSAPTASSPTWRDAQELAEAVVKILGGEAEAARQLNARCFYALACLAAVDVNKNGDEPLLGAEKVRLA
jgi:hypothetical protein